MSWNWSGIFSKIPTWLLYPFPLILNTPNPLIKKNHVQKSMCICIYVHIYIYTHRFFLFGWGMFWYSGARDCCSQESDTVPE